MSNALTAPAETHARPVHRRHRAFCKAIAQGMTQAEAYRRFVSRDKAKSPWHTQLAWNLANRFRAEIHRIQEQHLAKLDHSSILTKAQAAQFLSRRVLTPRSQLTEDSDLVDEISETTSPDGITRKTLKAGKKGDDIAQLGKLLGWESPTQVNHTHTLADSPALRALEQAATRSMHRQHQDNTGIVLDAELVQDQDKSIAYKSDRLCLDSESSLEPGQAQTETAVPVECIKPVEDGPPDQPLPASAWEDPEPAPASAQA